jgi:4-amino-4-deoxy-L-arabinose transferase-like glycosyltransferase
MSAVAVRHGVALAIAVVAPETGGVANYTRRANRLEAESVAARRSRGTRGRSVAKKPAPKPPSGAEVERAVSTPTRTRPDRRARGGVGQPALRGWLRRTRFERWLADGTVSINASDVATRVRWGLGIAVAAASFVLYILTTARYQIAGDTPDFLLAAQTNGVAHAPGYPSLVMLAHLFTYLPVSSVVFRMDLVAGACCAGTVAVVYATGLRLTNRPWPSAGGALVLSVAPLFWKWALVLETFPLNNLLVAAVIYCLVRWHQEPQRFGFLYGAALLFGVGLTNQQTIALLVPAIVLVLWLNRASLAQRWRAIGWCVLAALIGLVPYVYVPIAGGGSSPENWDYVRTFASFLSLVTRKDYGGTGLAPVSLNATGNYASAVGYFFVESGWILMVILAMGALVAYFKSRWYFAIVIVAFVTTIFEFVIVSGLNPRDPIELYILERFYLMPMVVLAPLGALGIAGATDWLRARLNPTRARTWHTSAIVSGVVVLLCFVSVTTNYSGNDLSTDQVTDQFARAILNEAPKNAILFVTADYADLPVWYAHFAEHVRPDVTVLISPILSSGWYRQIVRETEKIDLPSPATTLSIVQHNPNRPIVFFGDPPDKSLSGKYYLAQDGLNYNLVAQKTNILLTQFADENQAALTALAKDHLPPTPSSIKTASYESAILDTYANIPYAVGQNYAEDKQYSQALKWYERALAMDPSNTIIQAGVNQMNADLS